MLDGDLHLGPATGTYSSLFKKKKKNSNIPTVTPSLFTETRRITRHNVSVTRYKNVIKTAMTGRQPIKKQKKSGILCTVARKLSRRPTHIFALM